VNRAAALSVLPAAAASAAARVLPSLSIVARIAGDFVAHTATVRRRL
jgi:hypothetical protein